jgi:hypothetical protein
MWARSRPARGPATHGLLATWQLGAGRPLADRERRRLEARLGHDFRDVRVHDDARAVAAAGVLGARAFAFGSDVVLGANAAGDERVLAHELAHVAQQERRGAEGDPEAGARLAERGGPVGPAALGAAPVGLYAQDEEPERRAPPRTESPFTLRWDEALAPVPFLRPPFGVPGAAPARPSLGVGPLVPPFSVDPSLPHPALTPPPARPAADPSPDLPSRLSVLSSGRFSLGLRLGFPEPEEIRGAPPSLLGESLRRAEVMDQMLSGTVPQGWDAIDKGQLARAVWGIFSTHIAPDVARSITRGLSASTGPQGLNFELDVVLLTDFTGGGLTFTVRH